MSKSRLPATADPHGAGAPGGAAPNEPARLLALAVGGAVLVYTCGYLLWYSATALGLYPVLDAREHLELARRIADGALPREPFYRAPLFAALLALLVHGGVEPASLPIAARVVNGALHLASTLLVWRLSMQMWRRPGAAALSAPLFGLNPVVLYFSGDALDVPLASTLMLCACAAVLVAPERPRPAAWLALGGLACGAAILARPQLLGLLPALIAVTAYGVGRAGVRRVCALGAPALALLLAMGMVNDRVGGEFRILPWQGAYNLWAANGPEANGRYFVQQSRLAIHAEGVNPARVESEQRYRAERPGAPDDPSSMSRYWTQRTLAALRADPLRWLRLERAKLWYLVNNFEQYDLTTYHVHKAASPWLRANPLGWAVLLALAVAALVGARPVARAAATLGAVACAYTLVLLLTYVNARFRLPLVPLLAIVAGGSVSIAVDRRRRALIAGGAMTLLSAWPLPVAERDRTLVQDHLLQARAAAMLGFDDEALTSARAAIERAPDDAAARELLCVAAFNAWLRGPQRDDAFPLAPCANAAAVSPGARRVLGIAYWRRGRDAEALALWRALLDDGAEREDARAALIASGQDDPVGSADGVSNRASVVLLAQASRGDRDAAREVERRLGAAEAARQLAALRRTYARPRVPPGGP